jgi:HipA-like C-terminal domain
MQASYIRDEPIDLGDSVENEWLCAQILYHLGVPVARTEMWRFEDHKALVVTRFDRSWQEHKNGRKWIARLPQEDFCQALGYPPGKKYEKDGGPGIAKCMRLLAGSEDDGDRESFAITQLTFWLMAATDGHAKNYSIFLQPADTYITTPLYDVLSIFPYIGEGPNQFRWRKAELAFALRSKNVHYDLHGIQARHWYGLATQYGGAHVWERMLRHVERVELALERVEKDLPKEFPERTLALDLARDARTSGALSRRPCEPADVGSLLTTLAKTMLTMYEDSQIVVPPSFVALFIEPGHAKPNASREEILQRYDFCEDLATMLMETARTKLWELGVTELDVVARIHRGLRGGDVGVTEAEAGWVARRLAELLEWPDPPTASNATES